MIEGNNMKISTFILLIFTSFAVSAEIIDGPANLRLTPKGELAISLNDGVQVYINNKEGDWFKITFIAYVSKEDYRNGKALSKGVKLFNYYGDSIGQTSSSFDDFETFEFNDQVGLLISLYTYKNNIVEASILEDQIERLINSNQLNRNSLMNLKYLDIKRWHDVQGYNSGIVMEPLTGGPIPAGIRFIFFIKNQNVVAVAGNDKMRSLKFDCLGQTEFKELRLNVYYFQNQIFNKRGGVEKSLYAALSSMN